MKPVAWMRAEGLNQARAAPRLGITPHYLSELLSGRKRPSGELLARMWVESGGAITPVDFDWSARGNGK